MISTYLGKQNTVSIKFIRNNIPIVFATPVKWTLLGSEDDKIMSGSASNTNPGEWLVEFTIPTSYSLNTEYEDLTLEVYGSDTNKVARSREVSIRLMNYADEFASDILVYYPNKPIEGYIITPAVPVSVDCQIEDGAGNVLFSQSLGDLVTKVVRVAPNTPDRFEDSEVEISYKTKVVIDYQPGMSIAPYLVKYVITYAGDLTEDFLQQLYWTNNRILNTTMKLNSYLNKARLIEIDPSLQWMTEELVLSIYSGLEYINGYSPQITYWGFHDLPQGMDTFLMYAGAFHALNMRYLAEGLTAFQFSGLNTNLDVNRAETLTYKIEEIKDFLSRLEVIKKTTIKSVGVGIPDPTSGAVSGRTPIGIMGIQYSPVVNARYIGAGRSLRNSRLLRSGF